MAVYQFRGVYASSGKEIRGVRDADNLKGLRTVLRREGVVLTSAQEAHEAKATKARDLQLFAFLKKPSIADISNVTRQLATLIRAGIPLTESLSALTEQVEKEELKRVLGHVREMVNEGTAFATALSEHSQIFPPLYINMVAAGEASGTLENVLDRLATFLDSQAKLRSKISAAMMYPMLMMIIGSVLLTVLMTGVVPKVTAIFASLDRALPWYTSLLILISDGLSSQISHGVLLGALCGAGLYQLTVEPTQSANTLLKNSSASLKKKNKPKDFLLIIIAFLAFILEFFIRESITSLLIAMVPGLLLGLVIGMGFNWLKTPQGRVSKDNFILKVPVLGPLLQMIAVARFARTLATLLASGVQLLRAMVIVKAVVGNAAIEQVIEDATNSIREGESIAEPLKRSKKFPPIVTHMIAVGEKSGQLENMLETVSDSYENTVEIRITAATALLEPLTIVVMGAAIGFIAFAILMPLIQMNDFGQQ